jgi:hypothetical protein
MVGINIQALLPNQVEGYFHFWSVIYVDIKLYLWVLKGNKSVLR